MGIGGAGASAKRRGEFSALRCEPPQSPLLSHQPPPPPPDFSTTVSRAILIAAAIGLIYLVLVHSDFSTQQLLQISPSSSSSPDEDSSFHVFKSDDVTPQKKKQENDHGNELKFVLKNASMEDEKTVIITIVNATWTEPFSIFDLFLESLRNGNQTYKFLGNLVVVALDQEAYSRCSSLHAHCFALTTDGVNFSGEAHFTSGDYLKMTWRRIDFLRSVLEMGYNFIFSDADIAWMRDPFERLYRDGDFQIACDVYLNNSTNRLNYPNGGFVYVKSNPRTIQFYKYWHTKRDAFPGNHDLDVFNRIKFDSFIDEIGLDIRFLDTTYFGGFCEPSKDLDVVVTMHANCCTKLESKIHDIQMVIQDWKKYKMALKEEKSLTGRSWTLPRQCGVNESTVREMKALAHA